MNTIPCSNCDREWPPEDFDTDEGLLWSYFDGRSCGGMATPELLTEMTVSDVFEVPCPGCGAEVELLIEWHFEAVINNQYVLDEIDDVSAVVLGAPKLSDGRGQSEWRSAFNDFEVADAQIAWVNLNEEEEELEELEKERKRDIESILGLAFNLEAKDKLCRISFSPRNELLFFPMPLTTNSSLPFWRDCRKMGCLFPWWWISAKSTTT